MAWRVLARRTYTPSHHLIELIDAGAAEPIPYGFRSFPENGVLFGPAGVGVSVDSDTAVRITVGVGDGPRRGGRLAEGEIVVGATGLELTDAPLPGDALLAWPGGRTRVVVFGPPGDPYARRWIALALTPLDAPVPAAESLVEAIDRLVGRLGVRTAQQVAVEHLRKLGDAAKPRLLALLSDPMASAEARFGAAEALGRLGGADVVAPLLTALADPDAHVRRGAATGLLDMPAPVVEDRVIEALGRALEDHEDRISWIATMALGKHGDVRVLPTLTALLDGPPTMLADAALYALRDAGDASVLPTIERVLERCDRRWWGGFTPNVRHAAHQARVAIEARGRRRGRASGRGS